MIKGKMIDLIPLEEQYIELIRKWRMQQEVYDFMFCAQPVTDLAQKFWYEKISSDENSLYFLIMCKDSLPVGLISINDINYKNGTASWGYYIGELKYTSFGYGAEAEYLILKYAFEYLRLNKICCQMYAYNKDVISMHRRFGFMEEGLLRKQYYHRGDYQDVVIMGLLKCEFEAKKPELQKLFSKKSKEAKSEIL